MDTSLVYLSNLEFGAFLIYSPHGNSKSSIESRNLRDLVKRDGFLPDKRSFIAAAVQKFATTIQAGNVPGALSTILGPEKVLVPVPRSSPMSDPHALWVARRICEELVSVNLGKEVACLLKRVTPVQKAAFAKTAGKARPTVKEHVDSLKCEGGFSFGEDLTLVDDFVTSGTQLTAAASLLKAVHPSSNVSAFALVRTMSGEEVDRLVAPYVGVINYTVGRDYSNRD